jgi:3'5'-cyclic nucleotide phosphodiesterase
VFCALIHDVDHTGVSNGQLVKEKAHIATLYKNKSVAEQNSIDLAWDLLMQDDYENLRRCIYANADEFKRFRQLVVNTVLATDIFDKELSTLRKNRWAKAFSEVPVEEPVADTANRKATIVIEHLIQGSDVSHTMQVSYSRDD